MKIVQKQKREISHNKTPPNLGSGEDPGSNEDTGHTTKKIR